MLIGFAGFAVLLRDRLPDIVDAAARFDGISPLGVADTLHGATVDAIFACDIATVRRYVAFVDDGLLRSADNDLAEALVFS